MLSKNLYKKKSFRPNKKRKKLIISLVLIFAVFFIIYGLYTFQKLKSNKDKGTGTKIETGDRPLEQGVTIYVINADKGLSLRKERNTNSPRLVLIPNKTKLEALAEINGWYKVQYNGKEGWISKNYTTTKAPPVSPTGGWTYYSNAKFGYKIKYPLGWRYQDYGPVSTSKTLSLVAFSGQDLPSTIPAGTEFIAPITIEVSGKTFTEANKAFSSISGVITEPIKINSISAVKYTYTSISSNTQMTGIVFSAGGKTFIMNEGGGYSEDLIKMANTFSM